jgi:hypothetical protein
VFMNTAMADFGNTASTGAPAGMVPMLSRIPARSEKTTIETGPVFVPRTTNSPACPPPSRNALPGSITVVLVSDVQAATNQMSAKRSGRSAAGTDMGSPEIGERLVAQTYSRRLTAWMQRRSSAWRPAL